MNRDISINSFEGGMDLDSDNRIIQSNKTREAYNTDIRKSGNVSVVTDLKGESVLSVLEDTSIYEVFILASDSAQLLIQPINQTVDTVVFFYIRKSLNSFQFVIKFLRVENKSVIEFLVEDINEEAFNFLEKSTIDFVKIGKFGYDIFYFVDNLRQPRKLESIIYRTNETELTISTFEPPITDSGVNKKTVNLIVTPSGEILDGFRAYIYAYKTGRPFSDSTINPLTQTIKFLDFEAGDISSKPVFFDIYEEDYSSWTFEIVYHREGEDVFSNFLIGDPRLVTLSIGVLPNSFLLMQSFSGSPSSTQVPSWDFLYDGSVITVYSNDPVIVEGSTLLYNSPLESPSNLLPTGFYQDISIENLNKYVQTNNGLVVDYEINNGDVDPFFLPEFVESEVKLLATSFTEGNRNRLTSAQYDLPSSITVFGDIYNFHSISVRGVSDPSTFKTYTIERSLDLQPLISYIPDTVDLTVSAAGFSDGRPGGPVEVSIAASLSYPLTEDITVNCSMQVFIAAGGILSVFDSITIPAGQTFAVQSQDISISNEENIESVGGACINNFSYIGNETINPVNQC